MRATRLPVLCAACLPVLLAASASADPALDAAWAARGAPGGVARALAALEAAAARDDAGAPVFERLARLRFFEAKERLPAGAERSRALARCVDDGLRGLARLGGPGGGALEAADVEALDRLRDQVSPAAIGVLYWTALCYGASIPDLSMLKRAGAAKRFRRLVERVLAVDPRFFHGGPHRVLAGFLHAAPAFLGGDDELAREHADAAMAIAPRFAENPIARAENARLPDGDLDGYVADLDAAIAAPDGACPGDEPEQQAARAHARALRARASQAAR